jgi:DNA-binding SARP family transcriptional activator
LIRLAGLVTIDEGLDGSGAGQARHLSSAQAQVAFVRLVLERAAGTGRDQLADTIWPDGLPDTWASALRSVVSRVRSFVAGDSTADPPPLVAKGGRYLLRIPEGAVVDVERAEKEVAGAVAAYAKGDFEAALRLAGPAVTCLRRPLLPEHDGEWVNEVRARLDELLVTGLETAGLAAAALGDGGTALRFADEAVRHAPLRESAHRTRMTAHVAAGNRAEAMRCYHELRRVLSDELGIDPAPETQAAYLDLLGDPEDAAGAADDAPGPRPRAPFVGRREELAMLTQAWTKAENGVSHLVLVSGEPGVGKTRLVTQLARQVSLGGGLVLRGRCDRAAATPFQAVAEALAGLSAVDGDGPLGELAGAARTVLAGAGEADEAARARLAPAVADLLARISRERPAMVFLDALDDADPGTLAVLRQVFARRQGASLLVVATAGPPGRRGERLRRAIQEVDHDGWLFRLALRGLSEPDLHALVRAVVPKPFLREIPPARSLIADTAGNAYLLLEMLRWPCEQYGAGSPEELSPAVHEHVATRLAGLGPVARRLLRTAAVAGRTFELDVTVEAAGLDLDRAMDALETLLAAGIVSEAGRDGQAGHEYRFTHDVLRRAVYTRLSSVRRRGLHGRIADVIERRRTDLARYTAALAAHRSAGATPDGDQRAVRWAWRAAARASRDGAFDEAVRLHRDALAHVPAAESGLRAEALTYLGLAQLAAGRHQEGEQNLLDGALHAMHSERLPVAAQAALGLADAVAARPELRSEAGALIDLLVAEDADRPAARGHGADRIDELTLGRLLARQARLGSVVRVTPGVTAALDALAAELGLLAGPGELARRYTLAADMLELATAAGDTEARIVAAHHQAMAADLRGDLAARRAALTTLAAAANEAEAGSPADALLLEHAVAVAVTQGRFADAALAAEPAGIAGTGMSRPALAAGIGPDPGTLAARQLLVAGLLRKSSWPAGEERFAPGAGVAERSLLALTAGDRGRPHLTVRAFATGAEPLPGGDEWLHVLGVLSLAAVELGDPTTAEALRARLAPYAGLVCGVGYRTFAGPVSFHLGRLAAVVGDWDEAELRLDAALTELAERDAAPWLALTKQALAQVAADRARAGDRRPAPTLRAEANSALARAGLRHLVA